MANFFWKTAQQLRQPLAYVSAFAAGCLIVGDVHGNDNDQTEKPAATQLERILSEQDYRFSSVPPINSRIDSLAGDAKGPLRNQALTPRPIDSPITVPFATDGPTAKEILGRIKQPTNDSAREVTARMVMPVETIEEKQVWTAPKLAPQPGRNNLQRELAQSYPETLASFQEPAGFQDGNAAPSSLQSTAPANRVARAVPNFVPRKKWTGVHTLQNLDMQKFESEVVRTWGNQIRSSTSPDGRYVRVDLPTRVAHPMVMMIDRQTGVLSYEGHASLLSNWHQLMLGLDSRPLQHNDGSVTETIVVDQGKANVKTVRQAAFLMGMTQDQDDPKPGQAQATLAPGTIIPQADALQSTQGLKGTVKILEDPATGKITLVGDSEDLKIIMEVIKKINEDTERTAADVQRIPLTNLQSEAVAEQIQNMYDDRFSSNRGPATITPLQSPNSLIVLGQPEAIDSVRKIVKQMDVEADPGEMGGFKSFALRFISAADAKQRLDTYFNQANQTQGDNQLPSAPVIVVSDFRSNTIIVKGSVQFISQAEELLKILDVDSVANGAVNEVQIFPLKNTVAQDMAIVIQDAINGQQQNAGAGFNPNQQFAQQNAQNNQNPTPYDSRLRSPQLSMTTIDAQGEKVNGGFMFDVRVTADNNSNSLIVTGPAASMKLVGALIEKLDRLPSAETQIKVFEIVNGDAESLLSMLEALFGSNNQGNANQFQGQGGTNLTQLPLQGAGTDGQTLVNLRFSVDIRTNTIISSGAAGDLQVVEDLLNRLDAQLANAHKPEVYRLSNAPATDIAEAINAYLDTRGDIIAADPRAVGDINQTNRAVIVVPELVSNSLIVSALPQYRAEIEGIIKALDRRPPVIKIKVLIAEVDLDTLEEFGVELGVQDSLLFDRNTTLSAGGNILDGIGFPFNTDAPGNLNSISPGNVAGQALSNLGIGKVNSSLGYGGLVLSGGSESINVLIRALKNREAVRVLSKPHLTTVENLQGRVQIGSSVARVAGTTLAANGLSQQDVEFVDVGVILEVTPRVSPDGMIVMAVNAVKTAVGEQGTGTVVGFGGADNNIPILSPDINGVEANTTLMARSGQTVVFSGLIQETKVHVERGAPILSDLPYVGPLFKFEQDAARRTELLMFLTPEIVSDDISLQAQNKDEMGRMHWCLSDVAEVYGNPDYETYDQADSGVDTFYPDADPAGMNPQDLRPTQEAPQPNFESGVPQANRANPSGGPAPRPVSYSPARQK